MQNNFKQRGQAWRRGKRMKVKPLKKQRFTPGGPVASKCPRDCPYVTSDDRCRLRTDPMLHWQERIRCCFYEWWDEEKLGDARDAPLLESEPTTGC